MRLIPLFLLLLLTACEAKKKETKLDRMSWLLGEWKRTNNKPNRTGWESWTRISDTEWKCHSGTREGTDTIFHEVTSIVVEGEKVYFVADVPENNAPVRFEITSITDSSFNCENPKHDFPKMIRYHYDGARLYARVSAGDEGIDFEFERQ